MALAAKREENDRPTWPAPAQKHGSGAPSSRPTTTPDDPIDLRSRFSVVHPSGTQLRVWTANSVPLLTGFVPEGLGVRAAFLLMHVDGHLTVGEIAHCMQLPVDAILPHFIGLGILGAVEMARTVSVSSIQLRPSPAPTVKADEAKLVQLVPEADEPLPTLPGVTSTPWSQHTAVILRNGGVLDPRRNTIHSSIEEWRRSIIGESPGVQTLVNGQLVR